MGVYQKIKDSMGTLPILVVDDDQSIRLLISAYLENSGFQNIHMAENGVEGLEKIKAARPACVILDIEMPEMDGYEVMRHLKGVSGLEDLPILVITGHDSREARNEIMREGASNIISKPIDCDLLVERVTNLVERKLVIGQLTEFHERLTSELTLAAEMQLGLMPQRTDVFKIEEQYGVRIASHYRPSSELGGDSWFLQALDEDRFGIMLVDFSGHGVSASLNTFRLHTVISRMGMCGSSPAEYIGAINTEMAAMLAVEQFCTILYALVDTKQNILTYSAAAAPSPIFGQFENPEVILGDGSGLPVGILPQTVYKDHVVSFPKDSFMFLYSDALFETERNGDLGPLETDGVVVLTEQHKSPHAGRALASLLSAFYDDAPDPLPDDLTAVWLSR
jgi:phosphoserine phosphatase RsbU/P